MTAVGCYMSAIISWKSLFHLWQYMFGGYCWLFCPLGSIIFALGSWNDQDLLNLKKQGKKKKHRDFDLHTLRNDQWISFLLYLTPVKWKPFNQGEKPWKKGTWSGRGYHILATCLRASQYPRVREGASWECSFKSRHPQSPRNHPGF